MDNQTPNINPQPKKKLSNTVIVLIVSIAVLFSCGLCAIIGKLGNRNDSSVEKKDYSSSEKKKELEVSKPKYTIKVTSIGSSVRFSGSYLIVTSKGTEQKSVDGVTPMEYTFENGSTISCSFQKQDRKGNLVVELYKKGELIKSTNTEAEFGIVSLAY